MRQIPSGLDLARFKAAYKELLDADYEREKDAYSCRRCGAQVLSGTAYVSLHDARFPGCAGGGDVKTIDIPGCPACEPDGHTMHTCVHLAPGEEPYGFPFEERIIH
ncbi:MAG TPA: hypothetical protein VFL98_03190 [Candidatus Paceibacterota bacterium]|nr:hypothetical protein [Candidatus Paceibacterota bacterium]